MRAGLIMAIGSLLGTAACGTLLELGDEPVFDEGGPDAAHDGVDDGSSPDGGSPGDASSDAPSDALADAFDASDGCTGATLCQDFEGDAAVFFVDHTDPDGLGFVDDALARSPTHSFLSAVNALPTAHAFVKLPAGTYAGGVDVSFYYHVVGGFGVGATPIAQVLTTGTTYAVRVWLTPANVQLEWFDTGTNNGLGKANLAPRGFATWNLVSFKVRAMQVTSATGANVLGPQPQALSGSVELDLGILDNPQNQGASIRFDDVVVRPP